MFVAAMRGFMTHKGVPDYQRAARYILKDFVGVCMQQYYCRLQCIYVGLSI